MAEGRFVTYCRVSSKAQGQSGLGIEAQQEAVRQFLNGGDWSVIAEYVEVESGTRKGNNRPELTKALAKCKREKATLVIAKLDRLSRNVAFISNLLESGVEFVAADMPSANRLTIHILAAVAEEEARMISKRTKDALAAAKARGTKLGCPQNLSLEGQIRGAASNRKKAVESYRALEPLIAKLYYDMGLSLRAVAGRLNEQGDRTVTGAEFTAATVKRILDRK